MLVSRVTDVLAFCEPISLDCDRFGILSGSFAEDGTWYLWPRPAWFPTYGGTGQPEEAFVERAVVAAFVEEEVAGEPVGRSSGHTGSLLRAAAPVFVPGRESHPG